MLTRPSGNCLPWVPPASLVSVRLASGSSPIPLNRRRSTGDEVQRRAREGSRSGLGGTLVARLPVQVPPGGGRAQRHPPLDFGGGREAERRQEPVLLNKA